MIDKLDIRRPQVLVEAIIAEVQDGNGPDLGVQWTSKHGGVQFGATGLPISQIKNGTMKGRASRALRPASLTVISVR